MAQNNLGDLYRRGQGTRQDKVLAYALFDLASTFYDDAKSAKSSLREEMTASEVAKAQKLSSALQAGTPLPKSSRAQE
ncbi:SEL1-like repeat protein [Paraburkholderia sp. BR10937]|uniref:SEL1-like repeat protein n=1 Tax=Paraburkholderia sp. BR10937 TaxID=3236994 RepID=UPI0034D22EDC